MSASADSGSQLHELVETDGRLGYTRFECPADDCGWWVDGENAHLYDAHSCAGEISTPSDELVDVSDVEKPEDYVAKFYDGGQFTNSTFGEIYADLKDRPRSERVRLLFGFEPYDYQRAILDDPNPDVSVNMGRQVGKTETGGVIGADAALFSAGPTDDDVGFYGDVQDTATEMFRRCTKHLKNCPIPLDMLGVVKDNETFWEFDNGTRIITGSLNNGGDNERGKLPKVAIVDEAALCRRSSFERVIEPMFMTHGDSHELFVTSTPRGQTGYHYDANRPDLEPTYFSPHCVPSWGSPQVSTSWLEKKRANTDSDSWKQEYLGRFISEGNSYIPASTYRPCQSADLSIRDYDGATWVEGHPKPGVEYYGGCDIAGQGRDRTVYVIMTLSGEVVYIESEEKSTTPGVVGHIGELYERWDFERFFVDSNSLGEGVANYTDIDPMLGAVVDGINFSTPKKSEMYKTLKRDFEAGDLAIPKHGRMERETTRLEFEWTQNRHVKVDHPDNGHDDHPDGLALANLARSRASSTGSTRRDPHADDGRGAAGDRTPGRRDPYSDSGGGGAKRQMGRAGN